MNTSKTLPHTTSNCLPAAIWLALISVPAAGVSALAQLPPVNMGKAVHQPGDNQYMPHTQLQRHGTQYIDRTGLGQSIYVKQPVGDVSSIGATGSATGVHVGSAGSFAIDPMVLMYSDAPKTDISIEPIACDEPVPPENFPPFPDHIQLPGQNIANWADYGGRNAAGANGARAGAAPSGSNCAGAIGPIVEGVHQHYVHTAPGSFILPHGAPGAANATSIGSSAYIADPSSPVPGVSDRTSASLPSSTTPGGTVLPTHGYYKCGAVAPPSVDQGTCDTFNSNSGKQPPDTRMSGRAPGPPSYTGATSKDLRKLGAPPKLDESQDSPSCPALPTPALVSQSQTQDLSLPDDEFVSRYGLQDSSGKRFAKKAAKTAGRMVTRAASMAASRAYAVIP